MEVRIRKTALLGFVHRHQYWAGYSPECWV